MALRPAQLAPHGVLDALGDAFRMTKAWHQNRQAGAGPAVAGSGLAWDGGERGAPSLWPRDPSAPAEGTVGPPVSDAAIAGLCADQAPNGLFVVDETGRVIYLNDRCRRLIAPSRGCPDPLAQGPLGVEAFRVEVGAVAAPAMRGDATPRCRQMIARYRAQEGTERTVFETWTRLIGPAGQAWSMCLVRPLAQSQNDAHVEGYGVFDPMTHLPNQFMFRVMVDAAIRAARRDGSRVAVLMLDLDRFKAVNDDYGHKAGDSVLRLATERILECVRDSDVVARVGGDEFAIALIDPSGPAEASHVGERVLRALEQPMPLGAGLSVVVGCSIGIALFPGDGQDGESVLHHADLALYAAKRGGRHTVRFFNAAMGAAARRRLHIEGLVRSAVAEDRIEVHYQPVRVGGAIVSVEALARLRDSDGVLFGPDQFLDIAEGIGLGPAVGLRVLEIACHQMARWRQAFGPSFTLSVNASRRQIEAPGFARGVLDTLEAAGLAPSDLMIEIREDILMDSAALADGPLETLRAAGVWLAIDDFGLGCGALLRLAGLPVCCLKVSPRLLPDLTAPGRGPDLVALMVTIAERLGLSITIVGIETACQSRQFAAMHCDTQQGLYHGPPGAPSTITAALLAAASGDRAAAATVDGASPSVAAMPSGRTPIS